MKQAIILAAGLGSRLREITKVVPKSLIEIEGQPILERNVEYMIEAGICRIIIVVGYMRDKFDFLKEKYSDKVQIELVYNSEYSSYNTIYSLFCAREFFDCDTYITTADIYLKDNLYLKYNLNKSFYLLKKKEEFNKEEWVANFNEENRITSVNKHAYSGNSYTGISFWKTKELLIIKQRLEDVNWSDESIKQAYWDELLLNSFDIISVYAHLLENNNEIYEIDDIQDLEILKRDMTVKILFQNIGMHFGNKMLFKNVNFAIRNGEIFVLVGPSGSGKSTLLKMINKMVLPTEGKVIIDGDDISQLDTLFLRKSMGYMMQKVGLFPHMNNYENILIPFELRKENPDYEYIKYLTKKMDLTMKDLDKSPTSLSGGEKQRVGLIRALAGKPNLVLMDEPFSALDPVIRRVLQGLILDIQKDLKKTFIFVTHDMDEALRIADRIGFVKNGEVVQVGTPYEIINYPKNEYVSAFFRRGEN